jgi:hypothetical protein
LKRTAAAVNIMDWKTHETILCADHSRAPRSGEPGEEMEDGDGRTGFLFHLGVGY